MKMQLVSSATRLRDRFGLRGVPIRLVALGVTVVFTAGQMQAQGPIFREADAQPAAAAPVAQAAPQAGTESSAPVQASGLPEAPNASSESASVAAPLDLRAIMDDQAQTAEASQNVQPATQKKEHHAHPGLIVGGAVCLAFGSFVFAKGHGRLVPPVGGTFVAAGAGLAGLGLYLTFK